MIAAMKSLVILFSMLFVAGCATAPESGRSIVGTAFEAGGVSQKTQALLRQVRQKGGSDAKDIEDLKTSRAVDFSKVMQECTRLLQAESGKLRSASDKGLVVAVVGLVAGSIVGPTLVATNASKGAITFFSGLAGSTNMLQSELKQGGYDPQEYIDRTLAIKGAIKTRTLEYFAASDDAARERSTLGLSSDCLSS